ncbi:MAG: hypothetical protein H0U70_10635 [Tatlockia sp.]|nr:hypothetical protein [Tatlockia sp.]
MKSKSFTDLNLKKNSTNRSLAKYVLLGAVLGFLLVAIIAIFLLVSYGSAGIVPLLLGFGGLLGLGTLGTGLSLSGIGLAVIALFSGLGLAIGLWSNRSETKPENQEPNSLISYSEQDSTQQMFSKSFPKPSLQSTLPKESNSLSTPTNNRDTTKQGNKEQVSGNSEDISLDNLINEKHRLTKEINNKLGKNKGIFNPYGMYDGYEKDLRVLRKYEGDIEFLERDAKFSSVNPK